MQKHNYYLERLLILYEDSLTIYKSSFIREMCESHIKEKLASKVSKNQSRSKHGNNGVKTQ